MKFIKGFISICNLQVKDYKKYYTVPAAPDEVYLALTTATTLHLWTGEPAEMSTVQGSEFSLWSGSIVGKNLEFDRPKKIVQEWYFGTQEEKSIVTLKLHTIPSGTSVELHHTNIPDQEFDDIIEGWNQVYFASLRDFYEP